ncbi:serine/threonine-protein kinase [Microbacterium sp. B2969]|uniref:Serine/threonine-protein kinase n=1 Tax=Microbacterium alkaliflavum TaxID=3248839 RepID=A0ABW7Q4C9_9MICO
MTQGTDQPDTAALLDGRYHLHERLGVGGMAEVFRADDAMLGRTVAIKMLRSESDALAAPVRAQREVSALSRMTHPSLVTLLEAQIETNRARYLVMEFVDGPTLAQRLHEGPLPLAQARHLAIELASGLNAVHEAGLVHRDVKPSNILLAQASGVSAHFHVKLADFGLAQLASTAAVTTPGLVMGTAEYLAPEQVRGEACSPASDIYAFGLVLLESITGERAFPHASGIGAVIVRLIESPEIPASLDPQWTNLLRRMLATDPAQRPTALQLVHTLTSLPATDASHPSSELAHTPEVLRSATETDLARSRPLVGDARVRPVRHGRAWRLPRPLLAIVSVAAAVVLCSSAILTNLALPPDGSASADVPTSQRGVPGTLPGAATIDAVVQSETIDTVDAPVPPTTDSVTPGSPGTQGIHPPAHEDKGAQQDAHSTQKQADQAARQAEKDAASQQRDADKAARQADRGAKKNG